MKHAQGQLFLARDFDTYRLAKDLSFSCLAAEAIYTRSSHR